MIASNIRMKKEYDLREFEQGMVADRLIKVFQKLLISWDFWRS